MIVARTWVNQQLHSHLLSANYRVLDDDQLVAFVSEAQCSLVDIVEFYFQNGVLSKIDSKFSCSQVCSNLKQIPSVIPKFRVLAKLHKTPICSRPLVNANNYVVNPVCKFLNSKLQVLYEHCKCVLMSNHKYIHEHEHKFVGDDSLASADVNDMFTSCLSSSCQAWFFGP